MVVSPLTIKLPVTVKSLLTVNTSLVLPILTTDVKAVGKSELARAADVTALPDVFKKCPLVKLLGVSDKPRNVDVPAPTDTSLVPNFNLSLSSSSTHNVNALPGLSLTFVNCNPVGLYTKPLILALPPKVNNLGLLDALNVKELEAAKAAEAVPS